jgi:succinate--hydroxymethylglutarate CoA-transferase
MCDRLGKPEWKSDDRFTTNSLRVKNRNSLERMIEEITMTKETKEWLELLEGSGMPYAAVNDIQGTLHHEHGMKPSTISARETNFLVFARDMVKEVDHPACGPIKLVNTPVKFSHSEPSIRTPPPLLGQHTDELLTKVLGMTETEIQTLRSEGVVA